MAHIDVHTGDAVQVDLAGLRTPTLVMGSGVSALGRVAAIDEQERSIKVDLDVEIEGHSTVVVAPERVVAVAASGALPV